MLNVPQLREYRKVYRLGAPWCGPRGIRSAGIIASSLNVIPFVAVELSIGYGAKISADISCKAQNAMLMISAPVSLMQAKFSDGSRHGARTMGPRSPQKKIRNTFLRLYIANAESISTKHIGKHLEESKTHEKYEILDCICNVELQC